jgi:hypothetical protein
MARVRRPEQRPAETVKAGGEVVYVDGVERTQRPITAAAMNIDLGDKRMRKRLRATRTGQEWQDEAWSYFDTIGIVGFSGDFIANALSRLRWFIGWSEFPGDPPAEVRPDEAPDGMDLRAYGVASEALRRLNTGMGVTEMARKAAYSLTLPGEMYVIGRIDENGDERFDAWSTSEVDLASKDGAGPVKIRTSPSADSVIEVDPDTSVFVRIWRPHPRWSDLAMTPMRRLLEPCDELRLIRRYFRDAARSRTNGGIWMIPEEWGFSREANRNEDGTPGSDRMQDLMVEAWTMALDDEESGAAVIPIVVHSKSEFLGKAVYQTFDRPYDATASQRSERLHEEIAGGIDLPDQVVLGLGDVKFRNAEVITNEQFRLHLEPLAVVLVRSLAAGYLYPFMEAAGVDFEVARQFTFWYDPAQITADPDRSESSQFGYVNKLLSGVAWRTYNGYKDDDAPDEEELAQRASSTPAPPVSPLGNDATPTPNEQPVAPAADAQPPALAASAARRQVARLGGRLARAEMLTRRDLQNWTDQAMRRSFERIGAQVRSRPGMKAALAGVQNGAIVASLGVDAIAAAGVNPEAVVTEELGRLEDRWKAAAAAHVGNCVGLVARAAQQSPERVLANLGDRPARAIDHAWGTLVEKLRRLAGEPMFQALVAASATKLVVPATVSVVDEIGFDEGEFDAAVAVPAGLIREALSIIGGSPAPTPADPDSLGGVANGEFVDDALDEVGLGVEGYVWMYGDASTRSRTFEPHEDLDGEEFEDFTDPILTNSESFPDAPFYFPGDHAYCQCEYGPRIVDRVAAVPDPVSPSGLAERGLASAPANESAFAKSAVPSSTTEYPMPIRESPYPSSVEPTSVGGRR